jgi:hypothetical protein
LQKALPFGVAPRFLSGRGNKIAISVQSEPYCCPRPDTRELRREIPRQFGSRFAGQHLPHALGKRAPLFLDQASRRARNGIRLLLVKLRGAPLENDLLLVRAPQRQPTQADARQEDGEKKYPDASFHEARRRLSRCAAVFLPENRSPASVKTLGYFQKIHATPRGLVGTARRAVRSEFKFDRRIHDRTPQRGVPTTGPARLRRGFGAAGRPCG